MGKTVICRPFHGRTAGALWKIVLMNGTHCPFMEIYRFPIFERRSFDLKSIAKCCQNLDDLSDLEKAVLAFVLIRKVEIESDIVKTVGHF